MIDAPDIIEELLRLGEAHARIILLEKRARELTPFYHLVAGNGDKDILLQCHFANDFQKQVAFLTAQQKAKEIDAVAGMFIAESWMLSTKSHDIRVLDTMPRPSQHPDRVEVVMVVATTGSNSRSRMLRIIRDKPNGRITDLITEPNDIQDNLSGRMIDGLIDSTRSKRIVQ